MENEKGTAHTCCWTVIYPQQEERLSVSVLYTVKFTRFTDGRSAWCFLMSNATRILYGGKDKEFPRKSFTCEPFFCFFLIFSFAKLGFSVRYGVMTTGSFAGSNWFTREFGAFFITGTRMSGMKRIFLSRQSL